jgi:hypothetical protein
LAAGDPVAISAIGNDALLPFDLDGGAVTSGTGLVTLANLDIEPESFTVDIAPVLIPADF